EIRSYCMKIYRRRTPLMHARPAVVVPCVVTGTPAKARRACGPTPPEIAISAVRDPFPGSVLHGQVIVQPTGAAGRATATPSQGDSPRPPNQGRPDRPTMLVSPAAGDW